LQKVSPAVNLVAFARKAVCLVLTASLLAPSVTIAQQSSPSPTPAITPATPAPTTRPDVMSPISAPRVNPGPDYRLGPGDLLEIQITGRVDITRQQITVDLDGRVNIPPIGAVDVGGLPLLEAHRRIVERARALLRYADISVTVLAPRTFEVVLSGEVQRPGAILASATRRVHELIQSAGGITPSGSWRRVTVSRKGIQRQIDLLEFELRGDLSQNPAVEEDMTIYIPPRAGTVTLAGAVRRPGEYEVHPSGSLSELLELTGGLTQGAAPAEARLTRVGPEGRKETTSVDLANALGTSTDLTLKPGDLLFVPSLTVLQDVVELRGAFNGTTDSSKTTTAGKPTIVQRFELARGERVRDFVFKAGGAAAFADLRQAFVERVGTAGPRQRIPIDLHQLLVEKDETQNVVLDNGDVFTLPVIEDKVYVVGEVKTPGPVDFRPDFTPREYVTVAGGPGVRAKVANTTVTFRNGRTYAMAEAPPLEPGAVVTVPEVSVRWWQDYVYIAQVITSLASAYTGFYILFNGTLK
jgi:protein involved in polysaccharide export with SLBB domain